MPSAPRQVYRKVLNTAPASLSDAWRLRDYPQSVLQNGAGRYVCQLQRLTFNFCKTSEHSVGVRHFITDRLVDFARAYPGVCVYLQPELEEKPRVVGEYLNGRRALVRVAEMPMADVCKWVHYLRTRSGRRIARLESPMRTEIPSFQGVWTPFTNHRSTAAAVSEWPNEMLSRHGVIENEKTATERVMQMLAEQMDNVKIVS